MSAPPSASHPALAAGGGRLRVHGLAERSRANGPGLRAVIWVQGCTLGCPGCFNPASHAAGPLPDPPRADGRGVWPVETLVDWVRDRAGEVEGITVSGGEPLQQAEPLLALLTEVRATTSLSALVFSGYSRAEIAALPHGPALLDQIDVLIDGRYRSDERLADRLRGSANQEIHLLSDRYRIEDVECAPPGEISIGPDGSVVLTGVDPPRIKV